MEVQRKTIATVIVVAGAAEVALAVVAVPAVVRPVSTQVGAVWG